MSEMPNKHLMIDIETLDTKPGAAITAIGAVWFDPEDNAWRPTHRGFYVEVLLEDAMKYGTVSPSTLKFWMKQDDDARRFLTNDTGKVTLQHALQSLDAFIGHQSKHRERRDVYVWGNCNKFDLGILEAMYDKLEMAYPWNYGRGQNVRTVVWMATELFGCEKPAMKPGRTAHNALDDAIHQAEYVTEMIRTIRGMPDDSVRAD